MPAAWTLHLDDIPVGIKVHVHDVARLVDDSEDRHEEGGGLPRQLDQRGPFLRVLISLSVAEFAEGEHLLAPRQPRSRVLGHLADGGREALDDLLSSQRAHPSDRAWSTRTLRH